MSFPVAIQKAPDAKGVVFLSCYLSLSESLFQSIETVALQLRSEGSLLVFGTPDNPLKWKGKVCSFEIHSIPSSIQEHSWGLKKSDTVEPDQYDQWLMQVEAGWLGRRYQGDLKCNIGSLREEARVYLSHLRPSAALFWSCDVFPISRVWHDVAAELGIPAYCLEKGLVPGTWIIGYQSELRFRLRDRDVDKVSEGLVEFLRGTRSNSQSGRGQRSRVLVLGGADWAGLLPRTIPGAALKSPVFASSDDLAAEVAAMSKVFPAVDFLYRPHPFCLKGQDLGQMPLKVDVSTPAHELISSADVVVCGLTSLQYDALLMGKPVVLAAITPLWGWGIAYEVTGREELRIQLAAALARQDYDIRNLKADRFFEAALKISYALTDKVPARSLKLLGSDLAYMVASPETEIDRAGAARYIQARKASPSGRNSSKFFWDNGNGFNENNSESQVWFADGEEQVIEFNLPGSITGRFRFDPAEGPVAVVFSRFEVQAGGTWSDIGPLREVSHLGGDAIWLNGNLNQTLLSYGNAPQVYLKPIIDGVTGVRIRGKKLAGGISYFLAEAVKASLLPLEKVVDVALGEIEQNEIERAAISGVVVKAPNFAVSARSLDWHGTTWANAWNLLEGELRLIREQLIEQKAENHKLTATLTIAHEEEKERLTELLVQEKKRVGELEDLLTKTNRVAELQLFEYEREMEIARVEKKKILEAADAEIANLQASLSWRLTAPLRFIRDNGMQIWKKSTQR